MCRSTSCLQDSSSGPSRARFALRPLTGLLPVAASKLLWRCGVQSPIRARESPSRCELMRPRIPGHLSDHRTAQADRSSISASERGAGKGSSLAMPHVPAERWANCYGYSTGRRGITRCRQPGYRSRAPTSATRSFKQKGTRSHVVGADFLQDRESDLGTILGPGAQRVNSGGSRLTY